MVFLLVALLGFNDIIGGFSEEAISRGIGYQGPCKATAVFDWDNDKDLDLYLGTAQDTNILLNAYSPGYYSKYSSIRELFSYGWTTSLLVFDFNNDGFFDIFASDQNKNNVLYRNTGKNRFEDVATQFNLVRPKGATSLAAADFDKDGYPELVIMSINGLEVYRNQQGLALEKLTDLPAGIRATGTCVAIADIDRNGYPDIICGFDDSNLVILYYFPDWRWEVERLTELSHRAVGLAVGDVDNDLDPDVFLCRGGDHSLLLLNENGKLVNRSAQFGIFPNIYAVAGSFTDFDNDMDLDLYLIKGKANKGTQNQNMLFINDNNKLNYVPYQIAHVGNATSLVCEDLDRDGKVDIYFANENLPQEPARNIFYHNNIADNNYVTLILTGTRSGKKPLSTEVYLYAGGKTQLQNLYLSTGNSAAKSGNLYFGVGKATKVDSVLIKWSSGLEMIVQNLEINKYHYILEPPVGAKFTEVNISSEVKTLQGSALAVFDAFNDGLPDIFIGGSERNYILKQINTNNWQLLTNADWGEGSSAVCFNDFNNDGIIDVYCNGKTREMLLMGSASGYTDRAISAGLNGPMNLRRIAADFDNNGFTDMLLLNSIGTNKYYVNTGNNTFVDATQQANMVGSGSSNQASVCDFAGEGMIDVAVASGVGHIRLMVNENQGFFQEKGVELRISSPGPWECCTWGDFNGDGLWDIFGGHRNNGAGTIWYREPASTFAKFKLDSFYAKLQTTEFATNLDYDNDGYIDIATIENTKFHLYNNDRDTGFTEVTAEAGLPTFNGFNAIAIGDLNSDGFYDFVLTGTAGTRIYLNQTNENYWFAIQPKLLNNNPVPVGVQMQISSDSKKWLRQIESGSGVSQNQNLMLFGFGKVTEFNNAKIVWSSNKTTQLTGLDISHRLNSYVQVTPSITTEIENIKDNLVVLENIFSGYLTVTLANPKGNLKLYNLNGNLVIQHQVTSPTMLLQMPAGTQNGVYWLRHSEGSMVKVLYLK